MPLVDDRGRIFGRLNLIDAIVAAFLILLVPLGAAAYLMFRAPMPRLGSVEPTMLLPGVPKQRIHLHGENLRPYLRVNFNGHKAEQLLLLDFTSAEVVVPELPPGRYDVTLYDQAREVGKIENAITVPAPAPEPTTTIRLDGVFRGLTPQTAEALIKNPKLPDYGEILVAGTPRPEERWLVAGNIAPSIPVSQRTALPAAIRLTCTLRERQCRVNDIQLTPRTTLRLPTAAGEVEFFVEDVRADRDPVDVDARVTFLTRPSVAQLVSAGDRDNAGITSPTSFAWIVSMSPQQTVAGQTLFETERGGAVLTQRFAATISEPLTKFDAIVHFRVEESPAGWRFHDEPVKVGVPLTFETEKYVVRGLIGAVERVDRLPPGAQQTK
jgi:hypothetical protein